MTLATPTRQPSSTSVSARRVGYAIAVLVNGALLCAVNIWPGWHTVPFLTTDTRQILGLLNASIVVSLVANLVHLVRDSAWLKSLGDLATTGVGLTVLIRVWQVFPFDFAGSSFDWALLVRIVLVIGIVGSAIGVLVHVASLTRRGVGRG